MSATKGSWSWQRNSRASHPWNRVVACKSKNLELVFNWWVFCCSPCFFWNVRFLFVSSWFELFSFLSRKFWLVFGGSLKKIFFFLWKRFDFWSLELDTGNFEIEIWIFEIWDFGLKFEIWNLKPWDLGFETWYFEKLKLGILKICNLKFWTWNLKFEILGILNF